jgi:hypothetical protein
MSVFRRTLLLSFDKLSRHIRGRMSFALTEKPLHLFPRYRFSLFPDFHSRRGAKAQQENRRRTGRTNRTGRTLRRSAA